MTLYHIRRRELRYIVPPESRLLEGNGTVPRRRDLLRIVAMAHDVAEVPAPSYSTIAVEYSTLRGYDITEVSAMSNSTIAFE